jgi:hypothetical protein
MLQGIGKELLQLLVDLSLMQPWLLLLILRLKYLRVHGPLPWALLLSLLILKMWLNLEGLYHWQKPGWIQFQQWNNGLKLRHKQLHALTEIQMSLCINGTWLVIRLVKMMLVLRALWLLKWKRLLACMVPVKLLLVILTHILLIGVKKIKQLWYIHQLYTFRTLPPFHISPTYKIYLYWLYYLLWCYSELLIFTHKT